MSKDNYVKKETLQQMTILFPAPGANKGNTSVYSDAGSENGNATLYLTVKDPDVPKEMSEDIDLNIKEWFSIPSKYDIGTVSVSIKDGIIIIVVEASKDRIKAVDIVG